MLEYWCNAFRKKRTRQPFSMDTNNLIERFWQTLKYLALKVRMNRHAGGLAEMPAVCWQASRHGRLHRPGRQISTVAGMRMGAGRQVCVQTRAVVALMCLHVCLHPQGKNNKRMDFLLETLLGSLATFFEGQQAEKSSGRRTNWKLVKTIGQRELAALALFQAGSVELVDAETGSAKVKSSSRPGIVYEVSLQQAHCCCPDSTGLLCKHIRAAAM